MHLTEPESEGNIDCLPQYGIEQPLDRVLKLSQAFGGHLVAIALNSPQDAQSARAAVPLVPNARVRPSTFSRRRAS